MMLVKLFCEQEKGVPRQSSAKTHAIPVMVLCYDFPSRHPQLPHLFMEPPSVGDENLTLLIVYARLRIARTAAVTIVGV
jgi:hypothetical protein